MNASLEFPLSLLQAINDWQQGGDSSAKRTRGVRLKNAAHDLPERFRTTGLCCFRRVSLLGDSLQYMGENMILSETISAWTLDSEIAKAIKGGVPPEGEQGVIFSILPDTDHVIVNLCSLYADDAFKEVCQRHRKAIKNYEKGIGRYHSTQSEVILEYPEIPISSIYALGGYSSDLRQIASVFVGHQATEAELVLVKKLIEESGNHIGAHWITNGAKDRVVRRLVELARK